MSCRDPGFNLSTYVILGTFGRKLVFFSSDMTGGLTWDCFEVRSS